MLVRKLVKKPIEFYQKFISPLFAPRCRYAPSCSTYALEALEVHGVLKGLLLAIWRILRCNPWSLGGVDRVPVKGKWPSKPLNYTELMKERELSSSNIDLKVLPASENK